MLLTLIEIKVELPLYIWSNNLYKPYRNLFGFNHNIFYHKQSWKLYEQKLIENDPKF